MKAILTLFALTLTIFVNAQCIPEPSCTNTVTMVCNDLSNQSTNTNTCFTGYGTIPNSYNWNNWNWLQFHSVTASINIDQNLNLGFNKKLYNSGYAVSYWGNTSLSGGDTILVGTGCVLTINNPISNNSNPGQKNVIVLQTGARLLLGTSLVEYYVGDTIKTNPSNNSNNIYVVSCTSTALGNKITDFSIIGNTLSWFVEDSDNIQIQYSKDAIDFVSVYFTDKNAGYLKLNKSGHYRMKAGDVYSKTLPFNADEKDLKEELRYYYMGNFYKDPPNVPVYGIKRLK